ncbi:MULTISPECIES: hypothetical protein [Paraburkholderia]|uniref:hypothetical protein n=1 Tax=Paraburkholderia TaxID=1822464 RepID=UPI00224CDC5D|nr:MULTISPECIES: hypothetical protein [Paraburkholderia]MCX4175667.1 hypothetical protein [Paraburkholderia madseniana]MDQ6463662.1 hypothetical protein [Paraburkholderia madseniana]
MSPIAATAAFTRAAYLRAKVLDSLSGQGHDQALLFGSLNNDERADAYSEAQTALANEARKLLQLYPHPDFMAGRGWANANGFDE